jgi:hypothetical protein
MNAAVSLGVPPARDMGGRHVEEMRMTAVIGVGTTAPGFILFQADAPKELK